MAWKFTGPKTLFRLCRPALEHAESVRPHLPIRNINRVVGTTLGSEVTRRYGAAGLPEDTIRPELQGLGGPEFRGFLPPGITLTLEGDANDYVGKGFSGGKIVVYPPKGSTLPRTENVIIGNVAFYGATGGEAYIRGMAGERFCVRNSGVDAVVLGGGRPRLRVHDGRPGGGAGADRQELRGGHVRRRRLRPRRERRFPQELQPGDGEAVPRWRTRTRSSWCATLIRKHAHYTGSERAWFRCRNTGRRWRPHFVKVYPNDYRRVIETQKRFKSCGLSDDEAVMAAFEENAHDDLARVGGK